MTSIDNQSNGSEAPSTLANNLETENSVIQNSGDSENSQADTPAVQQPQRTSVFAMIKSLIFRMLVIYLISSFFRRSPQAPNNNTSGSTGLSGLENDSNNLQLPKYSISPGVNLYTKFARMDMLVYLSEDFKNPNFNDENCLFWHLKNFKYGDWAEGPEGDGTFTHIGDYKPSETLKRNGSLYIHTYFVPTGFSPDPLSRHYASKLTFHASKMITRFKRRAVSNTVNLLTGKTDGPQLTAEDLISADIGLDNSQISSSSVKPQLTASDGTPVSDVTSFRGQFLYLPPVTHWHPNLTIQLLDDHTPWTRGSVPPPLDEFVKFYEDTNEYYPSIFINDYWNLHESYQPLNETTPILQFRFVFAPISLFRWQIYLAQTLRNRYYGMFLGENAFKESDEDQDTFKKTLIETNPYLLGLTIVVSLVHSVFEILAFKNDIQFWRSRKSLEGLSVRSVFFNVFQSLIVVLYVFDNDTNFVVKMSIAVGLVIEMWKIKKVINIRVDFENKLFGLIPRVGFIDKSSYVESDTKKYDQLAFRYLSWLLFPLLGCYAVYSLLYQEHRGWYSWVLSMLYGFLLTFGFIMMTPQLFINYKMKSVAHLPWRMLTYKALNTFIDDIFAFVIKMPTLYRLGCLRDDVIFFIFLYQRWIYPMDPSRINEYGVSQEMLEKPVEESQQSALEAAPSASLEADLTNVEPVDSSVDSPKSSLQNGSPSTGVQQEEGIRQRR